MSSEAIGKFSAKDAISWLTVTKEAVGAVPTIGPILQGSVGVLVEVVKIVEKMGSNEERRETLLQRIHTISQILTSYKSPESSQSLRPGPLLYRLERFSHDITTLKPRLEKLRSYHRYHKLFRQETIAGYINDIDGIIEKAIQTFQLEGGIRQEVLLEKISFRLEEIWDGVNKLSHKPVNPIVPPDFLGPSARKCLEHTRVDLLKELHEWSHGLKLAEHRIVWMHGPPGSGKSTVARTIASNLHGEGLLAASFFFSRTIADRRNPYNVFPSIARQLSDFSTEFNTNSATLQQGEALDAQLRRLIIEPLTLIPSFDRPWIIILDALDECEDEAGAEEILALLGLHLDKLPHVQFFITSRPEHRIKRNFESHGNTSLKPHARAVNLHEIDISIVSGDIRRYLDSELRGEWARRKKVPPPSDDDLDSLTNAAAGLFIYAATCIKLIKADKKPLEVLRWLIKSRRDGNMTSLQGLDSLYLHIMESALRGRDEEAIDTFRRVLGAIVYLRNPLNCHDLSRLLGMNETEVSETLHPLSTVILVPELDASEIEFYHQSFRDFLVDHPRELSTEKRNIIHHKLYLHDKSSHDTYLAENCFMTFNEVLHRNMSGVEDLTKPNSEIPELTSRLKEILPPHARYACRFWSSHAYGSYTVRSTTVCGQLEYWARTHMLSWLESLSLCDDLDHAVFSLSEAERWYQECPSPQDDVVQLLNDGQRFMQMFSEPIEHSAGHIYCSALPFTPDCELRSKYLSFAKVKVVRGRNTEWPPLLLSIRARSGSVRSVGFSPDGRRVVSGSYDNKVRIWSSETGKLLSTLKGHTSWVLSVTFSPDGRRVVSGSRDETVRIWSSETGKLLSTLKGHMGEVNSVAFSPNGTQVVSGSDDNTVRIWSSETGKLLSTLEGHTSLVRSVAFSPDGRRVVSGSDDNTVRIWSSETGELLSTLEGHTHWVRSVAFSPNGRRVVSGSSDKTVRIWSSETGKLLSTLEGHTSLVRSVAFSPDGRRVVSGSDDNTVRIWSSETGELLSTLEGHISWVLSVAFSPDGRRVVSSSNDSTVRIWSLETRKLLSTLEGHTHWVNSGAFSPDGRRVVSGSSDNTVRIWSSEMGKLLSTLEGHARSVKSVALSLDGNHNVGEDELAPSLYIDDSGWVCDQTRSLCWVPPTLRPSEPIVQDVYRNAMCFVNEEGTIIILDFSQLLPNS